MALKYSEIKCNLTLFNGVEKNRKHVAEHDIFLLLNNGVAFSLECKTFEFVTKDALARLMRLSQSSGQISKMIVVIPFFPEIEPVIFEYLMTLYNNVRELGFRVLKFGPTQVEKTFIYKDEEYQNETFEDGLDSLFSAYLKK